MIVLPTVLALAAAGSFSVTGLMRRYALRRDLLDVPNPRSSHSVPTPRGGGAAIVVAVVTGMAALWAMGTIRIDDLVGIAGGGILVALAGFIDDHRDLSPAIRALVHAGAGAWAIAWVGAPAELDVGFAVVPLGRGGPVLSLIGIVWLTNLYNFMDGIDGLAASEAVLVGGAGGVLLLVLGAPSLASVSLLVASAALGFLAWNRPPARIFMGDVGSAFLGFVFGVLMIAGPPENGVPILSWTLLLGVFIGDATITLIRRFRAGERWHKPHRDHAYQRLIRAGWSHGRVTTAASFLTAILAVLAAAGVACPSIRGVVFAAGGVIVGMAYRAVERMKPLVFEPR